MKETNKGKCRICGNEFESRVMTRHISSCLEKETLSKGIPKKTERIFEIHITDKYDKTYWMYIEMNETEPLLSLDKFLRGIWCECCGHLSNFTICGIIFSRSPDSSWRKEQSMNIAVGNIFCEGRRFSYEYDYGSSTDLVLTVKSVRIGEPLENGIRILAKNNMPDHRCSVCGEKAAYINSWADYEDDIVFLCEECTDKLEEGELEVDVDLDALLPVCNSPRMGVCGYIGGFEDEVEYDESEFEGEYEDEEEDDDDDDDDEYVDFKDEL